jgi:predicted transcriptional regulator YdeE
MTNGFKLIGISVRTTNQNNQVQEDLGKLWGQFISENIYEKIPNKISNEILAIYTDYKNNYTEDYTTIIGVPVSTLNKIPDGMIGREFQLENFKKFVVKGEMPKAVVDIWTEIWQQDENLNRKYSYDFELYGENCQKGADSEVEIFVAVK